MSPVLRDRPAIAFRCDGGPVVGAGHVARCLPLAAAFATRGWVIRFVGHYDGLAAWMLKRAAHREELPTLGAPCGVVSDRYEAAVVDSYDLSAADVCELARTLPIATLAEAARCQAAGVLIDYHLDRIDDAPDARLLPGPAYAPLDPSFAAAGRAGQEVSSLLVTVGGSDGALDLLPRLLSSVEAAFPHVDVLVPRRSRANDVNPTRLVDLVSQVDLAVSAAGLTAYELASAGIPLVTAVIAANQNRVAAGFDLVGLGPSVDLRAPEGFARLAEALERLRPPDERQRLAALGRSIFDGRGAERSCDGLIERWGLRAQPRRRPPKFASDG